MTFLIIKAVNKDIKSKKKKKKVEENHVQKIVIPFDG